jgi:hypothetical protein
VKRPEFRARIRGLLGDSEPTGNPRFSDSLLDDWVDDEVLEISAEQPWAYTRIKSRLTLSPGRDTYMRPDTLRVDFVVGPDGQRLAFENEFESRDMGPNNSYTVPMDDPLTLRFLKVPEGRGTVTVYEYVRTPMPTDDTTDVPVPKEFNEVIVYRVAVKCAMRDRNLSLAGAFGQEAELLMRKIAHTQKGTRTSELQRITMLRAPMNSRRI